MPLGPSLGGAPTITYELASRCWWLCRSCAACERVVRVPLTPSDPSLGADPQGPRIPSPGIATRSCPGCETRRYRAEDIGRDPAVWYDTVLSDWVVRLPLGGSNAGAVLPLEITWFNAPFGEVYRTACDLVHAADALPQEAGISGPPEIERDREVEGAP